MSALPILRGGWGALLLLAPRAVLEAVGGARSSAIERATRLLGARHVLEAAVMTLRHDRVTPRWPIVVDAIHVASMLGLAVVSPRLRRDALLSAVTSGGLLGAAEADRQRKLGR